MSSDPLQRLEQPEYTGENRCWPCTVANLLIAAALAALVGRRNRALGILTFLGSAALIYLRGYLVPGTPELTKRYLPESVRSAFGKGGPEQIDETLARHAADRASDPDERLADSDSTEVPVTAPDDSAAPESEPTREELDELLEQSMDRILESFAVVEEGDDDLVLVGSFHEAWDAEIERLGDDTGAQAAAMAELFDEPADDAEIEHRDDGRYYGLIEGTRRHSWITEAALVSDLAANRVLVAREDPRWDALEPKERASILRGFRVFLSTCPECGGPVSPGEAVVESCCGSWDVIAVECADCGARVLELTPPDDEKQGGPDDPDKRGITR